MEWNKFLEEIKYEKNLIQYTVEMLSGKLDAKIPSKEIREAYSESQLGSGNSNGSSRKINHVYSKE
jgi:hypothetical protein